MQNIEIRADKTDYEAVKALLRRQNLSYTDLPGRRFDQDQMIFSLLVPATLTAIQIIASYLMSKRERKSEKSVNLGAKPIENIKIFIGGRLVSEGEVKKEEIERILGTKLSD